MADTQHNLRIKATLDTSQLQQDIDRLNQTGGQGSAGTSSAQSTTRILSKLDSTLNKLNSTIQQFSQALSKSSSSAGNAQLVGNIGTGIGYAPIQRPMRSRTRSVQIERILQKTDLDKIKEIVGPFLFDNYSPKISSSKSTPLDRKMAWASLRGNLVDMRHQLMNFMGPLSQQQQNTLNSIDNLLFTKRDMPTADWQSRRQNLIDQRDFRRRLASFGVGTTASFAAGQLSQWGEASDSTGLSLAGSVLGGAGAGAMTGAFFGPWGAAIGAAFGAVSQGALELVKSFKQLDEAARSRVLLSERAAASAAGGLEGIRAQRVVLGPEADRMLEVSQLELKTLEKSRENLLLRQQKLAAGEITDQTAEQIKRTAEDLSTTEAEISAKKSVIETLKSRKEALDEEVAAGYRLAEAEREFSKSIEDAEYRQRREWSEYNTSNIQANREALRSYRQQLASARSSQMMAVFNTGIESQLGQIRTNSFTGNKDPVYWFKLAREQRNYIGQFQQAALGTGDLQKMSEYMRKAAEASQKFQGFMQMAQVLKIMQIGQPVNRVDLQGLTSLAGRGGWMGEQYRQPEYMSTLEKMYDTLKSIDDNTRAAEKSVWQ